MGHKHCIDHGNFAPHFHKWNLWYIFTETKFLYLGPLEHSAADTSTVMRTRLFHARPPQSFAYQKMESPCVPKRSISQKKIHTAPVNTCFRSQMSKQNVSTLSVGKTIITTPVLSQYFPRSIFFPFKSWLRYFKTAGKQTNTTHFCRAKLQQEHCRIGGPNKPVQHTVLRFNSKENLWLIFCDNFPFYKCSNNDVLLISSLHSLLCVTIWEWNVNIINFLLNEIMTRSFHWNTE